jgi:hypothetical protein
MPEINLLKNQTMKKVMLLSAVALMGASVIVSCGGGMTEAEMQRLADSAKNSIDMSKLGETMMADTTKPADTTTAAPATTTTEEKK